MSRVLITGASTGFGRLLALALPDAGHEPVATMRHASSRPEASELRERGITVLDCDVTDDASVASCVAQAGRVDVLVNNAGFGIFGPAETVTPEDLIAQYDTNVAGAQRMARAVLPAMRERRDGLLVWVSSGAGRSGFPGQAAYGSSKWAMEALAEVYRWELAPLGIDSVIVEPGPYATDFGNGVVAASDRERAADYAHVSEAVAYRGRQTCEHDPSEVVDAIIALIATRRGSRPLRTVCHPYLQETLDELNAAHRKLSETMLKLYGPQGLDASGL